jgi:type IV pilus assembly protein PilV
MSDMDSAGFTLIEVLIAIVILTVGAMGWVMSQNSNLRTRYLSGSLATAQNLARSRVEDLTSTAENRKLSDGAISYLKTFVTSSVTYTVNATLNCTLINSASKPVWLITSITSFDKYGPHQVTLEKIVVGK